MPPSNTPWEIDRKFEDNGIVVSVSRRKSTPNQFSLNIGVRVGDRVMSHFPVFANRKDGKVTFTPMNMKNLSQLVEDAQEYILVEMQREEDEKNEAFYGKGKTSSEKIPEKRRGPVLGLKELSKQDAKKREAESAAK